MRLFATTFLILILSPIYAQKDLKKLKVFVTEDFNPKASITVEGFYDPLMASGALQNGLLLNGFKVVSNRVAQEQAEIIKDAVYDENSESEVITIGNKTYVKSVYVITMSYKSRADTGCGGSVMSVLTGQIVDLASDGELVGTFSFKQGGLEGKCADRIMESLASKLKKGSEK